MKLRMTGKKSLGNQCRVNDLDAPPITKTTWRLRNMGQQVTAITATILKAIVLAMSVAVVVLSILGEATVETSIALLGIGLFAIALASFIGGKEVH